MENIWGIKISRIALPEEKLNYNEWVNKFKVSSQYYDKKMIYNYMSLNTEYNFSKIKNRQNESTNTSAKPLKKSIANTISSIKKVWNIKISCLNF